MPESRNIRNPHAASTLAVGVPLLMLMLGLGSCAGNGGQASHVKGEAATSSAVAETPRAAFFEDRIGTDHLDRLAAAGFNMAMVHTIDHEPQAFEPWARRGREIGIETVPVLWLQVPKRQSPDGRRYVWSSKDGAVAESVIGCPVDSSFWWRSFHERADTLLARSSMHINLDMEIYFGKDVRGLAGHYSASPCECGSCRTEYDSSAGPGESMAGYQQRRLSAILTALFTDLRERYPEFEMSVFDLDLDLDVHRAIATGLERSGVPVVNYSEASLYRGRPFLWTPASVLSNVRERLPNVPVVGGLWLNVYEPDELEGAIRSVMKESVGYWIFSTYSLAEPDPDQLTGVWVLKGNQEDYWRAFHAVNGE